MVSRHRDRGGFGDDHVRAGPVPARRARTHHRHQLAAGHQPVQRDPRPDGTADSVVLTGGVRTPSDALVGPVADLTIRSLHFDLLFLGCYGFDVNAG